MKSPSCLDGPDIASMAALLFTCPNTRMEVQHWLDDDEDASEDDYEGIACQACAGVHFVNRKGKVLGGDDDFTSGLP